MGLKGGGTEKRGEETRFLKRGEANLGQGVVTLKKGGGGGWNPFTNYALQKTINLVYRMRQGFPWNFSQCT